MKCSTMSKMQRRSISRFATALIFFPTALVAALALGADDPVPAMSPATSASANSSAPPPPFTSPADVYSGMSGAGKPVMGDGRGGWRSGSEGIIYGGPNPKPGWNTDWGNRASGSAIQSGLIPAIKPIWDLHLRDTIICLAPDGYYYMTGSSGDNIWDRNDGVELWQSTDLRQWDYLGLVWGIEKDGTWEKQWRTLHNKPARNVWAPEIFFIKGNIYITLCMAPGGCQILKSTTGKPTGPYISTLAPNRPIAGGIDATLFEDDDGKVYFANGGGGRISLMKDDLSGIAESHTIQYEKPNESAWTRNSVGQEGVSIFKAGGRYYLTGAGFYKGRYSSLAAFSDNLFGPYKHWHEAVPCGGGTNYFQDKSGNWFCAVFGNDDQAPFREKPGLIKIEFAADGKVVVAKDQPDFSLQAGSPRP
jgi:xylan 1,4-beta-xylosidase